MQAAARILLQRRQQLQAQGSRVVVAQVKLFETGQGQSRCQKSAAFLCHAAPSQPSKHQDI